MIEFNYVDITTKGCEGWLNLFIDDECVALVKNEYIANKIRKIVKKKKLCYC